MCLSGQGATAQYYRGGLARVQEQRRFVRKARKRFFAKFRENQDRDRPVYITLVAIAAKFVALGCLRSTEHVLEFLTKTAEVGDALVGNIFGLQAKFWHE
jgi:hypothetical protein